MSDLRINNEFKNLIPPLMAEEREELERSILMFGCRDKIVTWNDTIIDGHNRYEICTRNNVKFGVLKMDYDFENEEEVKQWIIKNQFARRNISSYQRSVLALQLKESIAKKAKENQKLSDGRPEKGSQKSANLNSEEKELVHQKSDKAIRGIIFQKSAEHINDTKEEKLQPLQKTSKPENDNLKEPIEVIEGQVDIDECIELNLSKDNSELKPIDTREEIAKIAGVSHDTIHKVETIEKEAPEAVREAAKENVISINKAYKITKEVKDLEEEEKENKAEELLNKQYLEKAKQIDKEKKIADKIADVIYGILTTTVDEERIGCYLEYSPKEPLEKHIARCDEAITKLQEIKSIFENMKKIKVVK
ncbi:hypothetical protein N4T77_16930 [Clostridium sp. CX1]|uniref:hypothetical protein n=1 Tax=Clostridium sp. CX1 TaxID=2978346 RepID=UPI0021BF0ECD|nr:hypothetical protein [Clostridium sp. CX1]MCT8978274.1 hypothetical protein [Clostridium sp. CX1]